MPNEHYQSLFGLAGEALRERFLDGAPAAVERGQSPTCRTTSWPRWSPTWAATTCGRCWTRSPHATPMTDRPSVVFAYTVKGWGLPIAGNPRNHSALLTAGADRRRCGPRPGLTRGTEWDRFDPRHRGRASGPARARSTCPRAAASAAPRGRPCPTHRDAGQPSRCPPRRCSAGSWSTCPGTSVAPYLVTTAPGRGHLDQPGRVHQPDRGVRPGRAPVLERRPGAALGRGPGGPAHRAGHLAR